MALMVGINAQGQQDHSGSLATDSSTLTSLTITVPPDRAHRFGLGVKRLCQICGPSNTRAGRLQSVIPH